ncbi:hypothetical protein HYDPIDRAFT_34942 [Hydnomerulius pinastri MD-312]|uniref:Uncharacterized protein n=1 Tax=Hydnomerulius pinastri MD-312 TaxID=994086 RepID=A0A0C9VWL7_9AGAM|nr:hypothetical protein HYDPIDRAFT_34942 [Hydnomerulius pinastri MD-312]
MDVRVVYDTSASSSFKLHQPEDISPASSHIPLYAPTPRLTPAEDGPALILLSLLLANMRNCSLPLSRLCALDILLALSARLMDGLKLE